ncbi:MAG: glycosyltransferase [Alphaproteobacteria bacterium]|nr:glycosyltransferase [Alphaproteobacteria bacterium]
MKTIMLAAAIAAAIAVAAWLRLSERTLPPDLAQGVTSLSYNFMSPAEQSATGVQSERILKRVGDDLSTLSELTSAIRLYASSGVFTEVPAIARRHGFSLIAGAWVGKDIEFNQLEISSAVRLVNRHPNIRSLVVGNETILRKELNVAELTKVLRQVRRQVRVPVSTGETWDIWLKHPELAKEVDFIAAHILPYWEGIAADRAVPYAMERYEDLRKAFPGKKIVIAEFGWPSRGYNNKQADASPALQAKVIGDFLVAARQRGITYNVIEAIDQPWKTTEGSVGAYWGLYDNDRKLKFTTDGIAAEENETWRTVLAVVLGFAVTVLALGISQRRPTFAHALGVAVAAQALAAGVAMAALYPFENYLNTGSAIAWVVGFALMIPLTAMTLIKVHEVAEITLGRAPTRLIYDKVPRPAGWRAPKVSIHVPAYREKPEMLIATMNSLAALDYPDFEVLVIVNNTPDEAFWRPIETRCAELGERFKFVYLPKIDGFKAGALTAAMARAAPDAEVLAFVDADYVVEPTWLNEMLPAFADPSVAFIQAPQEHRDGKASLFKSIMNSEYAGFFDIGMVQRNEDNAIIAHGTMLLVRRSVFEAVGGWATDTITEDTELGLRLFRAGWQALYTTRRYGRGLLPDTYAAFKTQRERWAYGAVQIIRKHWRAMLPSGCELTAAQKFHFLTGWTLWLSDSFGVVAAYLNLLWVPMILFVGVLIPMLPFTVPILAMLGVNLLHCALLYGVRVKLPPHKILGAAVAAMSLQMTVARGVAKGFGRVRLPFLRTDKGGIVASTKRARKSSPVLTEAVTGVALLAGAITLHVTNVTEMVEITVFAATLLGQSIPFLCAPLLYCLDRAARGAQPAVAQVQPMAVTPVPAIAPTQKAA